MLPSNNNNKKNISSRNYDKVEKNSNVTIYFLSVCTVLRETNLDGYQCRCRIIILYAEFICIYFFRHGFIGSFRAENIAPIQSSFTYFLAFQ